MVLSKLSSNFHETINLPASKSLSNRWLILNACSEQKITMHNLSKASDTVLMQELLNKIFVSTSLNDQSKNPIEINCKNAGTVLRFLTAYLSTTPGKWHITGDYRLKERPITDLVEALKSLGADIEETISIKTEELLDRIFNAPKTKTIIKSLPLTIVGKSEFSGFRVKLNMEKSSQFASALMLMISKFPNGLRIDFEGEVISKPYMDMTAKILEQCGVYVERSEKNIILSGKPNCLQKEIFIESDWSAASYFYGFVALSENGTIEFENLYSQSLQGDSIVAKWFKKFGVETTFTSKKTILKKVSKPLTSALEFDFTDYPDLAQTIAVVCAALNISAKLTGLSSLKDKETDRLQALSKELNFIGAKNIIEQNSLILFQHSDLDFSKSIFTYNDHRMAMAFSIFSGLYDSVKIEYPEVVDKSFPDFWDELNKLNEVK
jgi:3-phosphoshikimate 1-carboxyvinyltransferase